MTQPTTSPPRPPAASARRRAGFELRRVHSDELLAGSQEIEIIHRNQCYRLRITSLGKLILTK
jgi:hemin uptake protein HemP